jgi:rare lipoprotein A
MLKSLSVAIATLGVLGTSLPANAASCGSASFYGVGDPYHGRRTASGEIFDAYGLTTASKTLPFGTRIRVTNQSNGKSVVVRVNDDGPHVYGRILDLSYGAFSRISSPSQGVIPRVCFTRL